MVKNDVFCTILAQLFQLVNVLRKSPIYESIQNSIGYKLIKNFSGELFLTYGYGQNTENT